MGPRLFGIVATDADAVAVLRRGPSGWCHVSRWLPGAGQVLEGSWLRGTIYPQRCDLSPDGQWLAYFALKAGARWNVGDTYLAISRLPWLAALAAWSTCGTWTRGLHFVSDRAVLDPGPADDGDISPLARSYGLAGTAAETFTVERRGGWTESVGTPPRAAHDIWDEDRANNVTMERVSPGGSSTWLSVRGRHAAFRTSSPAWGRPSYRVRTKQGSIALEDVQWADWSRDGRLLVATSSGKLEIRSAPYDDDAVMWARDLASLRPMPEPPPPEASSWSSTSDVRGRRA